MKTNQNVPNYRTFVITLSFWVALGMAASLTGLSGIVAAFWIVLYEQTYAPSIGELWEAGANLLALSLFSVVWVLSLISQHDKWERLFKAQQRPQSKRVPRPLAPRNMGEARQMSSQMAVGKRRFFPLFAHHYKALYLRLERNKWKITKRALNFEVDTVKVFPNIGEKYMDIIEEWNRCNFIDGYVNGEAREKWFLSEAGQLHFADVGNITSPTEND